MTDDLSHLELKRSSIAKSIGEKKKKFSRTAPSELFCSVAELQLQNASANRVQFTYLT